MCGGVCSKCNKVFVTYGSFESHPCVAESSKLSSEQLLEEIYKSGGCSKEYYEEAMQQCVGKTVSKTKADKLF